MSRWFAVAGLVLAAIVVPLAGAEAPPPPSVPPLPAGPPGLPPRPQPPAALTPIPGPTSLAAGVPWCGRLVAGVRLGAGGAHFFTHEFPTAISPSPPWRRYATRRLIDVLRGVAGDYRRAHPDAARLGVADLSLPQGGAFGPRYGGLGHNSHQNGLDADVLYPRRDRREAPPARLADVDRARAQELVDRFLAAGAQYVFVGHGLGLRGPRGVVVAIAHHQDHMHVRIPPVATVRPPKRCPWKPT